MPVGIGWQARYSVDGGKVHIAHRAYRIDLFGLSLRLPLEWLLGRGTAEEEALDDTHFRMAMTIDHPLLGTVYGYRGTFTISSMKGGTQ